MTSAPARPGTALQQLYLTSSFRYPGIADLVLDDIERQIDKPHAKIQIAYVITAGNLHPADQRGWIDDGRKILLARGYQVRDIDITDKSKSEVAAELAGVDVIFV